MHGQRILGRRYIRIANQANNGRVVFLTVADSFILFRQPRAQGAGLGRNQAIGLLKIGVLAMLDDNVMKFLIEQGNRPPILRILGFCLLVEMPPLGASLPCCSWYRARRVVFLSSVLMVFMLEKTY